MKTWDNIQVGDRLIGKASGTLCKVIEIEHLNVVGGKSMSRIRIEYEDSHSKSWYTLERLKDCFDLIVEDEWKLGPGDKLVSKEDGLVYRVTGIRTDSRGEMVYRVNGTWHYLPALKRNYEQPTPSKMRISHGHLFTLEGGIVTVDPPLREYDADLALELSIEKWQFIVDCLQEGKKVEVDGGPSTCALCTAFREQSVDCFGCPVQEKTKWTGCKRTPYEKWEGLKFSATLEDREFYARQELEFLKGLRGEKKEWWEALQPGDKLIGRGSGTAYTVRGVRPDRVLIEVEIEDVVHQFRPPVLKGEGKCGG